MSNYTKCICQQKLLRFCSDLQFCSVIENSRIAPFSNLMTHFGYSDEILKYVMSRSTIPRQRLSLFLSAKLIYGTVIVYRQQVINLQSSTIFFSQCIKKPIYRFTDEIDVESDLRKKHKKVTQPHKTKRTKKDLPQIEGVIALDDLDLPTENVLTVDNFEQMFLAGVNENVTDPIHITLQEEVSTRINIAQESNLFGDEGQIDNQLQELRDIQWNPLDEQLQPIPTTTAPITPTADKRRATLQDVEESPRKRRKSESVTKIRSHDDADRLLMPPPAPSHQQSPSAQQQIPPEPGIRPVPSSRAVERTQLTNAEILENLNRPVRQRNVRKRLNFNIVLTPSRWLRDANYDHAKYICKVEKGRCLIDTNIRTRYQDPVDIINEMLKGLQCDKEDITSVIRDIKDERTLEQNSRAQQLRSANGEERRQTLDPVALPEFTTSAAEIRAAAVENLPEVLILPSPTIPRVPDDSAQPVPVPESTITETRVAQVSTPSRSRFGIEAKRQADLLNTIQEVFRRVNYQPIKLADICVPLTRDNVAKTFNALLHLHAKQYILLKSCAESLELQEILPGPRINE